jgi:hypothetical protein
MTERQIELLGLDVAGESMGRGFLGLLNFEKMSIVRVIFVGGGTGNEYSGRTVYVWRIPRQAEVVRSAFANRGFFYEGSS